MSAIAARRAAALAASQNATPSSSAVATPIKGRSPSLENEEIDMDEKEEEEEAASSSASISTPSSSPPPPPVSNKKRKLGKSSPLPVQGRYLSQVKTPKKTTTVQTRTSGRKRELQFSPSAPAINNDEDASDLDLGSESVSDSSVGDSDADLAEDGDEEDQEAINAVDEGRAQWNIPNTSAESTPGPSRTRIRPIIQEGPNNTSKLTPVDNVNIHRLSSVELTKAGLKDDYSGDGILISLNEEETIIITGTYVLTPILNKISTLSCTLSPGDVSYPVFAPTSHPIPVISTASSTTENESVPWLSKLKLPKGFRKSGTLILIRENLCGIHGLRYGAVPGFANIWLEEIGSWGLRGIHPVIGSFSTPIYPHMTPTTWSKALSTLPSHSESQNEEYEDIQKPFIGLVKGPKRSGKSTFARSILNNLLESYERVAWLECDLGQSEFCPGGVIGLWVLDKQVLGPAFTHLLIPYRAHYLGTYTPLTCPDEYVESLRHLLEVYKFEIQHSSSSTLLHSTKINDIVPLVINTQGWVKGLGEDLLRSIESLSEPTHIYSFNSNSPYEDDLPINSSGNGWTNSPTYQTSLLPDIYSSKNYDIGGNGNHEQKTKQIILDSIPITPLQAKFTATDFRVLSLISHFHCTKFENEVVKWDFTKPITHLNPWEVSYGLKQEEEGINRIYMIGEGSEGILKEDLHLALNGSIVALCEANSHESNFADEAGDDHEKVYEQGRSSPSLESMNFLGLALIKSISPDSDISISTNSTQQEKEQPSGKLHLLTPLPIDQLVKANCIIKNGAIELSTPGMINWLIPPNQQLDDQDEIPFFDKSGIEVIGGERRRFRKNIMRKGM
ncbi:uncharacterized protein L201_003458 [Kwoniella dendrophila CBS 6074]|uniref:Polynucleotide 5'-hydroxyl-kinase GRC3 n=1 Tax=Kwoniella dendrophila CBS 6074 TaxID=1295534 RepID=A0AAX4JSZ3_9TREE